MLERKRILKVKEQIVRDGQRVFLRTAEDRRHLHHRRPEPALDQLEEVQRDVAMLLEQE